MDFEEFAIACRSPKGWAFVVFAGARISVSDFMVEARGVERVALRRHRVGSSATFDYTFYVVQKG